MRRIALAGAAVMAGLAVAASATGCGPGPGGAAAGPPKVAGGVVAISCGTYGNVVRLLPPLVITDEQLADGLDVLGAAVRSAS